MTDEAELPPQPRVVIREGHAYVLRDGGVAFVSAIRPESYPVVKRRRRRDGGEVRIETKPVVHYVVEGEAPNYRRDLDSFTSQVVRQALTARPAQARPVFKRKGEGRG